MLGPMCPGKVINKETWRKERRQVLTWGGRITSEKARSQERRLGHY